MSLPPFHTENPLRWRARIPAVNRRIFLVGGALGITGLLTEAARADHHTVSANPLMVEFDLASAVTRYTPAEDFFVRDHANQPPALQTPVLHLIGKGVHRELPMNELRRIPLQSFGSTLECAGNGVGTGGVSNGLWHGWAFADLFKAAGFGPSSPWVHLRGRDGYVRSVPVEQAWHDGFLVVSLNQRPLPLRHGSPWRALLRGWYGMNSVKWLESIEFGDRPLPGNSSAYLELLRRPDGSIEKRPLPRMQIKSAIIAPAADAVLRRGNVEIRGLAWTGTGAVAAVEVRAGEHGAWTPAHLEAWGRNEWIFWRWNTHITTRGPVSFTCRARDTQGATQPEARDHRRLDGYANHWCHQIRCVVV